MKTPCVILGLLLSCVVNASLLVAVEIDKDVYMLNETVKVYVSLYNPTGDTVTINCTYPVATYLMDNVFYWHQDKVFPLGFPPPVILQAGETKIWQLEHGSRESGSYSLGIGNHTVHGVFNFNTTGTQYSDLVEFQVIPEPTTSLLVIFGAALLRKSQKHLKK
jgi:hypothetical protein